MLVLLQCPYNYYYYYYYYNLHTTQLSTVEEVSALLLLLLLLLLLNHDYSTFQKTVQQKKFYTILLPTFFAPTEPLLT